MHVFGLFYYSFIILNVLLFLFLLHLDTNSHKVLVAFQRCVIKSIAYLFVLLDVLCCTQLNFHALFLTWRFTIYKHTLFCFNNTFEDDFKYRITSTAAEQSSSTPN